MADENLTVEAGSQSVEEVYELRQGRWDESGACLVVMRLVLGGNLRWLERSYVRLNVNASIPCDVRSVICQISVPGSAQV